MTTVLLPPISGGCEPAARYGTKGLYRVNALEQAVMYVNDGDLTVPSNGYHPHTEAVSEAVADGRPMPALVLPEREGNPFVRMLNPANRPAFPRPPDGGCGKCGAPAQMFRRIRWFGMRIRFCARCGCDHTTRAGPGVPDECGVPVGDTGTACTYLQPCPVHGGVAAASPYVLASVRGTSGLAV